MQKEDQECVETIWAVKSSLRLPIQQTVQNKGYFTLTF